MVCKNVAQVFHNFLYVQGISMNVQGGYRNSNPNLTVHIENEHTKNTESNPFNKPKRDTMS